MRGNEQQLQLRHQWKPNAIISFSSIQEHYITLALQYSDVAILKICKYSNAQNVEVEDAFHEVAQHHFPITCAQLFEKEEEIILCSSSSDKTIISHLEKDTLEVLHHQTLEDVEVEAAAIAFDESGCLIVIAAEKDVLVFQVNSGELFLQLEGHFSNVTNCKFHPLRPEILITSSVDKSFKLWNLASQSLEYQSSIISAYPITSLSVSEHSGNLCLGFSNGDIQIYDIRPLGVKKITELNVSDYLGKLMMKEKINRNQPESNVATPIVVSSLPSWAMSEKAKSTAEKRKKTCFDDGECISEISPSIISSEYIGCNKFVEKRKSKSADHLRFQPPEADSELIFQPAEWLIVCTSSYLIKINCNSYEITLIQDFQSDDLVGTKVGLVTRVCLCPLERMQLVNCILISAFQPILTHICVNTKVVDIAIAKCCDNQFGNDEVDLISIFPTSHPVDSSPLKCITEIRGRSNKRNNSSKKQPKDSKKKPNGDKPVTFHATVRSSGYSNNKKVSKDKKVRKSKFLCENKEYPLQCNMLRHYQLKNALPHNVLNFGPINNIEYSSDGRQIAIATNEAIAHALLLPFSKYKGEGTTLVGHNSNISTVHWSYNNKYLITCSADHTAKLWYPEMQNDFIFEWDVSKKKSGFPKEITDIRFYYLDNFIILARSNEISLYQYEVKDIPRKTNLVEVQNEPACISKLVAKWKYEDTKQVSSIVCSNSFLSHLVLSSGTNRSIHIRDLSANKTVRIIPDSHSRSVHTLCLPTSSPFTSHPPSAYDFFLSAAADSTINLWDLRSNKVGMRFGEHQNRVHKTGLAFSPCMRYIATGSEDKVCYIYDIRTGRFLERLHGHTDVVTSVSYHPLFPQLATSSFDGKIRFYTDTE